MSSEERPVLRCSFCNKAQQHAKKLIAGPAVYICDECVGVCNDILEEDGIHVLRGARAAQRELAHADEYLRMAADLSSAANYLGAAREVRNAALGALRALALFNGDGAAEWKETKVVAVALESDPEIARLLHVEDSAHVLLRVSLDGAVLTAGAVESAAAVAKTLVALARRKAGAQPAAPPV